MTKLTRFTASVRTLAAALALSLSGAAASAQEFQVPMDASFSEGSIQFTGEFGHVYYFRWNARPHQGQVAVCGAGYLRDIRLSGTIRDMARNGEVRVGDTVFPVDLSFFTRARTRTALATTPATCRVVGPIPRGATSANIRFGDGVFRN
jgi:hypothetical protein